MGEYGREQRNQLSRAVANSETGSRQLKGFVDNRRRTKIKQNLGDRTTQCRFYPPLPEDGLEWNNLLDKINIVIERHNLPNNADIVNYITTSESDWYDDKDHSIAVNHFNFICTLKYKVQEGIRTLKIIPTNIQNWQDIIDAIRLIKNIGYFQVNINERVSYDGGTGLTWYMVEHGLRGGWKYNAMGDSQLRGAIGACRNVITFHNEAVDLEIENWDK